MLKPIMSNATQHRFQYRYQEKRVNNFEVIDTLKDNIFFFVPLTHN